MTFTKSPGVFVNEISENSSPSLFETLEEVKKACQEACAHNLFRPNTEINAHIIRQEMIDLVYQIYASGFYIFDIEDEPIFDVEDVDIVVDMGEETQIYLIPTQSYWHRKMERRYGNLEEFILTI